MEILNKKVFILFITYSILVFTLINFFLYLNGFNILGLYLKNNDSDYIAKSLLVLPFMLPLINLIFAKILNQNIIKISNYFIYLLKTKEVLLKDSFINYFIDRIPVLIYFMTPLVMTATICIAYLIFAYFYDYSVTPSHRDDREEVIYITSLMVLGIFLLGKIRDLIIEIALPNNK